MNIYSFLKRDKTVINSIESVLEDPNKYFIRMDFLNDYELNEVLHGEEFYIEGGIYLEYNGTIIMGFKEWDLLDQLWIYFISAIHEVHVQKNKEVNFTFPDQPLKVKVKDCYSDMLIKIGDNNLLIPKNKFLNEFCREAKYCLSRFQKILGCDYSDELSQIDEILLMP